MMNDKGKSVKTVLIILFLAFNIFSFKSSFAQVQSQSDFEILKGKNDSDIVYRGTVTFEDIRRIPAFNFEQSVNNYKPVSKPVKALANELQNYKLIVFLGTWCEDSHRMIPQLYKVLEAVNYPMKNLSLNALDREKHGKNDLPAKYSVTLVPTIVVLKDDKEIGRITEIVDKNVEQDLLKIITH